MTAKTAVRADEIYSSRYVDRAKRTDRLFGVLFPFQWLLGIIFAVFISPRTWSGEYSQVHIHVYAAVFLGGIIAAFPTYLTLTNPGAALNRIVVSISQILFSVLFIHLTGGRIETHFHIFGSLAFLAFYRDWRPVAIGTVITAMDHLIRGLWWPESVYGVLTASPWRALEHAAWVVFEDIILFYSIRLALNELRAFSKAQAEMEGAMSQLKVASRQAMNYRNALETFAIVTMTDKQGVFTYANDNFCKISQFSKEELLGKTHAIINSGYHPRKFFSEMWGTISSGQVWAGEIQNKAKDGTLYWVDSTIVPLVDEEGNIREYLAIRKEVTTRKALENTLAMERVKLGEAVVTAERANLAKTVFLANMSHELRTPMHGILSYARFGQQKIESAPKEKLKSYFDEIYESGSRLMTRLNALLDLSKLEAGKVVYAIQERDLVEVAAVIKSEMQAFATEKGLTIELKHEAQAALAAFDQERIMQVLRNLVSNAIKFSIGGAPVRIELSTVGHGIRCAVVNRGVGIPRDELKTVFDKFVQSSKTKSGAGGTGLGLAICKEIVEQHHGKIWAESDPGGETRFIFEIQEAA